MAAVIAVESGRGRLLWRRIGWSVMTLLAFFAAANAFLFAFLPEGLDPAQKSRMFEIAIIGYTHTLGGAIASVIGPFQFVRALRQRYPRWHVWLGRIYLTCVGSSALAGLYLSPDSAARNTFGIAFIALALAWLYTGIMAYTTIRARRVEEHRRWMIRNFALTYAAVTLRIEMPLFIIVGGLSPQTALDIIGWFCWVPNLILVELWMRRRRTPPLAMEPV